MSEPRWLAVGDALAIHADQLAAIGGGSGLRDRGGLESALDRPRNKWAYGVEDRAELAAAYAFGIARNHPFVDGSERVAFLAAAAFLRLNRVPFTFERDEAITTMLALAAGGIGEAEVAA